MQTDFKSKMNNESTVSFPKVSERPVYWGKANLQRAQDHKAIVDVETGKVFSVVSENYRLIKHEAAINQVEEVLDEDPQFRMYTAKTGFFNDGARMRRTYRFPEISVEIQEGDMVNPQLHITNSYDLIWPFIVLLGAFRIICTNGLIIGDEYLHFRKRHVIELSDIELKEQIFTALQRFDLQTSQWKKWTMRSLTEQEYSRVMDAMKLGGKATGAIEDRIRQEAEGFQNSFPIITLWIFYNVLTWFITFHSVSLNHQVALEGRLRTALKYFR